jgi:UDP-glucose 4-epimerase
VRTLITGGAGFIGSHLVDHLLRAGDEVVVLDDLSSGTMQNLRHIPAHLPLTMVVGSIVDRDLVERFVARTDRVFHLAAAVGPRRVVDHPLQSLRTNLHGTENVLEAANVHRRPVLLASTGEVYGRNSSQRLTEDSDRIFGSVHKARWAYAAAKGIDEAMAYAYFREYGLPVVIARLFNTVGARQRGWYGMVMPALIGQALRNEVVVVHGDGEQTRCFGYVGDVVPALAALVASPAALGTAVNLGGRHEVSINTLAERVVTLLGSSSAIVHLPHLQAYGPEYEDTRRRVPDNGLAAQLVGFNPHTSLDEMILQVANSLIAIDALPGAHSADLWAS